MKKTEMISLRSFERKLKRLANTSEECSQLHARLKAMLDGFEANMSSFEPSKAKAIKENITRDELLKEFEVHRNEGWSAVSFKGRMKVGLKTIKLWRERFPTFDQAYQQARDNERIKSIYNHRQGPRGSV